MLVVLCCKSQTTSASEQRVQNRCFVHIIERIKMEHIYRVMIYYCTVVLAVQAGQYCGKSGEQEFYCDKGHCCGDFKCCAYYRYYEMWWFWLIWCIIIMLGCSCAYYRRNQMGPYSYLASMFYPSPAIPPPAIPPPAIPTPAILPPSTTTTNDTSFKLPTYEEAIAMQQLGPPNDNEGAPPPYMLFAESETQSECTLIEDHVDINTTHTCTSPLIQYP